MSQMCSEWVVLYILTCNATPFIGEEVTYTDCDAVLLDDIDLVTREVFLPLLCADESHVKGSSVSADRLMDQLHRITANAEVSSGYIKVCDVTSLMCSVYCIVLHITIM